MEYILIVVGIWLCINSISYGIFEYKENQNKLRWNIHHNYFFGKFYICHHYAIVEELKVRDVSKRGKISTFGTGLV